MLRARAVLSTNVLLRNVEENEKRNLFCKITLINKNFLYILSKVGCFAILGIQFFPGGVTTCFRRDERGWSFSLMKKMQIHRF